MTDLWSLIIIILQNVLEPYINSLYDSENGIKNNEDLYSDVKLLNGKRLFDELNDADLFNIHILKENQNEGKISTYFNSDLNSIILEIPQNHEILQKIAKKFGHLIFLLYFCTRFPKESTCDSPKIG